MFKYKLYNRYIMKTTIQVNKKTLERLKTFKITKRDTYEEIINRLMDK